MNKIDKSKLKREGLKMFKTVFDLPYRSKLMDELDEKNMDEYHTMKEVKKITQKTRHFFNFLSRLYKFICYYFDNHSHRSIFYKIRHQFRIMCLSGSNPTNELNDILRSKSNLDYEFKNIPDGLPLSTRRYRKIKWIVIKKLKLLIDFEYICGLKKFGVI